MTVSTDIEAAVDRHRQQFSSLADKRYFNYGGQGPMADSALAAMAQLQHKVQTEGPFAKGVNEWLQHEGHQIREAIARALGAAPETITLTENVTAGCNIPLWGLPWQSGDRILLGDCEHPGVVAAVEELCRRYGLSASTCELSSAGNGGDPVGSIARALRPNTRLVIISHILWNTGQVLPLKEIVQTCHANAPQTRVLVDAAQSVGVLPLDCTGQTLPETGVDYYAFTGHKWWCGPSGLGALYVRPAVLAETAPTFVGWRGIEIDGAGQPTGWAADGRRFEVASSAYGLWAALGQAMAVQASWGSSEARYARICALSARLWEGLRALPRVRCVLKHAPPPSGLVSFQLLGRDGQPSPELHGALVAQLETEHVFLRTLMSPNCVRACAHYLTLEAEVDDLIARLASFVANL